MAARARITVRGIVQGVGFRPYVYNLAQSLNLKGFVTNTSEGVTMEIEGENVFEFIERLPKESPPLSRIIDVSIVPQPLFGFADFRIIESLDDRSYAPFTLISPDVSLCNDCLKELLDPGNRRYLYPFINCTNCGPRYTITKSVPYDRPNTTMSAFDMCPECLEEYHNPSDRRFHAQPNACRKCGPQVEFKIQNSKFKIKGNENPIEATIRLLKEAAVVAIKGLGGFHIACDAMNEEAVRMLRERKRRSNKPFALMAPDVETIRKFCDISDEEKQLLLSRRRPIVLLRKKDGSEKAVSEEVSPNNRYLGFMLPYTPLHYLLFHYPCSFHDSRFAIHGHFDALVMTSGNLTEEPLIKDNDEALRKLSGLADAFLLHNRDIFMRVDDSVLRIAECGLRNEKSEIQNPKSKISFIRRSRGYAPEPIALHSEGPEVMGCGADIKNTFTVTKGAFAIPSQHIGDMENYETLKFFEESLKNIRAIYRVNPIAFGHDLHPGYLSTRWALEHGSNVKGQGMKIFGIQHHYAHIGSVMAEHGLNEKVIGVAFDGTGYGTDGNLWGGEFLVADMEGFERVGHLRYIPLPGGETAIREPWRTAVSYIFDAAGDEAIRYLESVGFIDRYGKDNIEKIIHIIKSRELSPLSSGTGRLFDAVSALIGLCDRNTFEGEAAMALESLIREQGDADYPVNIVLAESIIIDFSQAMINIVNDLSYGVQKHVISMKFHNTISNVILKVVLKVSETRGPKDVVLSGGTFQNMYLLNRISRMLISHGLNVFINREVPCNDACISLGQAYLVRERLKL